MEFSSLSSFCYTCLIFCMKEEFDSSIVCTKSAKKMFSTRVAALDPGKTHPEPQPCSEPQIIKIELEAYRVSKK